MPALVEASGTLKSSDLDGRCDGAMLNETGLLDWYTGLDDLYSEFITSCNRLSQTMFTDPSMMDTDGDGLSDGLEVAGWEVHIIRETTKEEVLNWTTFSNPTIADTDLDGVNDYYEFENQSDPRKNDTDGDYILDCLEAQGELTQIDGKPPEILKVDGSHIQVKVEIIYSYLIPKESKVKITVKAHDAAGLDRFEFILQGEGTKQVFVTDGSLEKTVSVTFTCGVGRALGRGWDLEVKVYDRNGNGNRTRTHIDGALEGVVKALIKEFMALVEAIKELVSKLFDWIWNFFENLLNGVIKPILQQINIFKIDLLNFYSSILNIDFNGGRGVEISEAIGWSFGLLLMSSTLVLSILALVIAITVAEKLTQIFTFGATSTCLILDIIDFLTTLIITIVFIDLLSEGLMTLNNLVIDPESTQKLVSYVPTETIFYSEIFINMGNLFLLIGTSIAFYCRGILALASAPLALLLSFIAMIILFISSQTIPTRGENSKAYLEKSIYDGTSLYLGAIGLKLLNALNPANFGSASSLKYWYPLLYPISKSISIIVVVYSLSAFIKDISNCILFAIHGH